MKARGLFFTAFLLLSGCVDVYDDVSRMVDKARCNLRVGILAETRLSAPQTDKAFRTALAYFAAREVDAVVIAGNVTHDGCLAQWRGVRDLWEKAFPKGCRADGQPVELIVVAGEDDSEKVYEQLTGRPYATVFAREVKGFTFVGANWKDATGVDAWALKPLLAKTDGTKPFFYVQSLVPYGTCCPNERRTDVFEGGKVSYMLSKYPNAVAICGRAHTPLTDESAFWRGAFTCVNAGTFSYARMRGKEEGIRQGVRHGLVMSVYDSSIVFERLDFARTKSGRGGAREMVEKLGEDWTVMLPAEPSERTASSAPQFWDDTRLMVFPSEKVISVRFPPVLAKHTGVRAYAYEVVARGEDGREITSGTTWSPGFCGSEENETKPVTVNFPREGLPKGRVRFEVTPLDAFGHGGRTIAEEVVL